MDNYTKLIIAYAVMTVLATILFRNWYKKNLDKKYPVDDEISKRIEERMRKAKSEVRNG